MLKARYKHGVFCFFVEVHTGLKGSVSKFEVHLRLNVYDYDSQSADDFHGRTVLNVAALLDAAASDAPIYERLWR